MPAVDVGRVDVHGAGGGVHLQVVAEHRQVPLQSEAEAASVRLESQVDRISCGHGPLGAQVGSVHFLVVVGQRLVVGHVLAQAVGCKKNVRLYWKEHFQLNHLNCVEVILFYNFHARSHLIEKFTGSYCQLHFVFEDPHIGSLVLRCLFCLKWLRSANHLS